MRQIVGVLSFCAEVAQVLLEYHIVGEDSFDPQYDPTVQSTHSSMWQYHATLSV